MSQCLAVHRCRAASRQAYRCFYCNLPLWDSSPDRFISRYQLSRAQAALLRCTAEHLNPLSQGGSNASDNIVAACHFCNQTRHKARNPLDPEKFRQRVRQKMQQGQWLAGVLPRTVAVVT